MFASQILHRLFSYDNYRENNTIGNVLGVRIFSFLPADFILIMMDNHFITSGTLIQKQRCIALSIRTKIKCTKKKLWNSEIVYFSWSSMLFISFFKNQSLCSNLKSETCQTCNTSQRKCHGIINNTWFQGKAISPEENRPGSKDSNWQKINKILEGFNSLK